MVVGFLSMAVLSRGDEVVLGPIKDNSIYSENGARSNGQGRSIFTGKTRGQLGTDRRRALIAFDVAQRCGKLALENRTQVCGGNVRLAGLKANLRGSKDLQKVRKAISVLLISLSG
jgi:hypothetical protein